MPGLNIIVASADWGRFCAALETAIAAAALGQPARVFLQGDAAAMLRAPAGFAGDGARRSAGLPGLGELIDEALASGVEMVVCQSGLALSDLTADRIVGGVKAGGVVSFLAAVAAEDRLVVY
ncbi:DsrE family protein [Sphingopyxis kveilinensis]|uniref:DsrE family protein n=1 Tax=Sphingopyxis kveilinensis TaxID=3114367 RepID=UPI0030CD0886